MRIFTKIFFVLALAAASGCSDAGLGDDAPDVPSSGGSGGQEKPSAPSYNEQYRPQIHYTPAKNWINDPNGLVYADGVYHMFYQYNPYGNDWGNMSWGHAVSEDLLHWEEKPVALTADHLGAIFSGSAVVDKRNTAGFGKEAIIALYTSAGDRQQQSIAYSTDGAETFTTYSSNPVIANTSRSDFRDPKVFWHEESQSWIMSLALGWEYGIEFYSSKNLKNWTSLSVFTNDRSSCRAGQWECPDLLRFECNGVEKWVLLVSVNPGGPAGGSGTMYFVGTFDGKKFIADNLDYPLWLDYGPDNYAGVTWSNIEDRTVYVGWMNNWLYSGVVPASPWRSAMTLPRELSLVKIDGMYVLASKVVREIEDIAGEWEEVEDGMFGDKMFGIRDSYQLRLNGDMTKEGIYLLSNTKGEYLEFSVNPAKRNIVAKRTGATGKAGFSDSFSMSSLKMPVPGGDDIVELDIFVDRSSVEMILSDGSSAMTMLVYPQEIYSGIHCTDAELDAKVRTLSRVWK